MLLYHCQKGNHLTIANGNAARLNRWRKENYMNEMNEYEQKKIAIEKYINIQRIKKHGQEEIDYQEKIAKAELQILGISTEDLEIDQKEKPWN